MKKIALAAALSVAATSAFAGSLKPPVMERRSSWLKPKNRRRLRGSFRFLLLVVVAAAIAASN